MGYNLMRLGEFISALTRLAFWALFFAYPVMLFQFFAPQAGNMALFEIVGSLLIGIVPFGLLWRAKNKSYYDQHVAATVWGVLALFASTLIAGELVGPHDWRRWARRFWCHRSLPERLVHPNHDRSVHVSSGAGRVSARVE